jgi:hypothetical protein
MSKAQDTLKTICEAGKKAEKADSWRVFINGHDTGIVETNYEYANKYWAKVAVAKDAVIELKKIKWSDLPDIGFWHKETPY